MRKANFISYMFVDIGGLLTDGWDHKPRKKATTNNDFSLSKKENKQKEYKNHN